MLLFLPEENYEYFQERSYCCNFFGVVYSFCREFFRDGIVEGSLTMVV